MNIPFLNIEFEKLPTHIFSCMKNSFRLSHLTDKYQFITFTYLSKGKLGKKSSKLEKKMLCCQLTKNIVLIKEKQGYTAET